MLIGFPFETYASVSLVMRFFSQAAQQVFQQVKEVKGENKQLCLLPQVNSLMNKQAAI